MMSSEQEIRFSNEAANSSQNQNVQSPLDMSHSHSINTISSVRDYIISEDLLAGQRIDGRMSNVRRFFCLFVTFDLLFTSLMWIICIMLKGENIFKALGEQIVHYDIHTSLFDIVLTAFCRFFVLILFYAILYVSHWLIISLSTAITCAFLMAKVFVYDWPHSSQPVFEVLLVLTSFVISWGEAWFLDFRVIPQESHANRYLISATESERAPLIRSYVQGLPSMYTESIGNFYSPLGTPEGSLYRFQDAPVLGIYPPANFSKEQEDTYKCMAAKALQDAWDLLKKTDWKLEKQNGQDCVFSRNHSKLGRIYKLHAQVDASPKFLLEELYYKVQEFPKWNSAILESHKIQSIDENTDISYQISTDAVGGLVSSRDFVSLRHWAFVDECYVLASVKTDHPSLPAGKKFVRGENGIGCWAMHPVAGKPNTCNFTWILNMDLKIWLPKAVLEKEVAAMMFKYLRELRQHVNESRENIRRN